MGKLAVRFPDFLEVFDGHKMRALVSHLEILFARITVDDTRPAYTTTTSITLGAQDDVVLVDTTAGNITITLPEISDTMIRDKREFEIVKAVAANTLTIDPTGTDTINGAANATTTTQWTAYRLRAATGLWVRL